jgi:hypothetical protein
MHSLAEGELETLIASVGGLRGVVARLVAKLPQEQWLEVCGLQHAYTLVSEESGNGQ